MIAALGIVGAILSLFTQPGGASAPLTVPEGKASASMSPPGEAIPLTHPIARHVTLASGAVLVHIPSAREAPWSNFRIAVRVGSALDPPGKLGLARVLGLVWAGAIEEPKDEPRLLSRLGAQLDVETGLTSITLFGGAPTERLDAVMRRLFGAMREPSLSEEAVRRAVARAIEERLFIRNDDRLLAELEIRRVLFGAHPYGTSPWGEVRDLASISSDDVRALFRGHLYPPSIVVGIASSMDGVEIAAREWMADLPPAASRATEIAPPIERPAFQGRKIVLIDRPEGRAAHVLVGSRAADVPQNDVPALWAAHTLIGGTFSSRLTEVLARARGLAPFALSRLDRHKLAGVFSIWLSLGEEDVSRALRILLEELDKLGESGPTSAEIDFGRRSAAGRANLELRDASLHLRAAVNAQLLGLPEGAPEALAESIEARSESEIRAAVRSLAAPREIAIVVVARETPSLQRALAGLPGIRNVSIVSHDDR